MAINMGMAFYNRNGIILRETPQEDKAFVEVEFKFLDLKKLNDQLLISIAAMYMIFKEDLKTDYVISAWSHQQCVLRATGFDLAAKQKLIDAVVGIRARMGLVYRLADEYFYREDKGGILPTNNDPELERYRVTDCFGKAFVEAFSQEFRQG